VAHARGQPSGHAPCLAALTPAAAWHTLAVEPIRMVETSPTVFSLMLDAGTTDVDEVIEELDHEPNGYFWEGIAQLLVDTEAPHLEGRFDYDPEGDTFVAHGSDRPALDELAALMTAVATNPDRLRRLVALARDRGFEFDD
jgi:Immunity protein 51